MNNIDIKPTFLLSKAVLIPGELPEECDVKKNCKEQNLQNLISSVSFGTQSKTFAAPGDDDPDPEAEICF